MVVANNNSVKISNIPAWLLKHSLCSVLEALRLRYERDNSQHDGSYIVIDKRSLQQIECIFDLRFEAKARINYGDISGYGDKIDDHTCYIDFPFLGDKAVLKDAETDYIFAEISLSPVPKRRPPE